MFNCCSNTGNLEHNIIRNTGMRNECLINNTITGHLVLIQNCIFCKIHTCISDETKNSEQNL